MTTNLEIFNMALLDLELSPVQSTEGSQPEHDAYRVYFENALRNALIDIKPKFATKHEQLSLLSDTTVPGYDYVYQRPGDALVVINITDSEANQSVSKSDSGVDTQIQWEELRLGDESKNVIATEIESAYCKYVSYVRETTMFGSDFIDAMHYRLASDCAPYLGKSNLKDKYFALYQNEVSKARIRNNLQSKRNKPQYEGYTDNR